MSILSSPVVPVSAQSLYKLLRVLLLSISFHSTSEGFKWTGSVEVIQQKAAERDERQ